ncbi:MAG: GAF domain-containing protein [Anaerolineales bacterium]|nr:GAF domain-containing protein [Anaerolineales bacterium]
MNQPAEKNFNIFISLLLQGCGVGLVIIPSHLGLANDIFYPWFLGLVGILSFIVGLSLQVISVWEVARWRDFLIKGTSIVLLITLGFMLLLSGHITGAASIWVSGAMQLGLFLRLHERIKNIDYSQLTITLITSVAGIVLSASSSSLRQDGGFVYVPLLAISFLFAAFMSVAGMMIPSFKYKSLLHHLQILPWMAFVIFFIIPSGIDDMVTPTAVIGILVFEKIVSWKSFIVPERDILSRRVVMIAYFAEIAHLVFLGAILYVIDPALKNESNVILTAREATLAFFLLFSAMIYYAATTVIMTTSGLIEELNKTGDENEEASELAISEAKKWGSRLERYIKPFIMTPEGIRGRIQADQINMLARQTAVEKKRNAQLTLLLELSQQLENQLDKPVSAQLTVNTLERALNCSMVVVFTHESEEKEFVILAATGKQTHLIPIGYRQNATKGIIGRALRQRKTQIANDLQTDQDYIYLKDEDSRSAAVIPLIFNGHVQGMIVLNSEHTSAFGSLEIGLVEMVAAELTRAWERSGYHQRLTELVQTGSQLSSAPDPETTAQEVASISRNIVQSKFTYIYIQLGQERNFIQRASSGNAPLLLDSLKDPDISGNLIDMALHASQPFRIRDVRRYDKTSHLTLDNNGLRSLLTIPIRWHHVNIGAIFAFGKQNEVFFTENDESLAELISIQAGGAFESTWLQQELRASLRITSLLYRLSNQIIQAENIEDAASDIAQTAHKLGKNLLTGIVLLDPDHSVIAEVCINDEGVCHNADHPMSLIRDAMTSGQMIYFSQGQSVLRTCLPIQTPIRGYGAIWMDNLEDPTKPATNPNDLQALVNQAAIALERSLLLVESRRQAKEIKAAYDTLEATYDQTLASLTSALDARDRETEGHSLRVTQMAVKLGEFIGYSQDQLKILERGSLLHDIGKIGISDTILHKPGPLTEEEWKIMKLHPDIGSRIVEGIPFLEDTIQLIRGHQERWDGTGYPDGLRENEIPELARLFSVIDAFDALTSNRPYRKKISVDEALDYLKSESGVLFDPSMVTAFETLIKQNPDLLVFTE